MDNKNIIIALLIIIIAILATGVLVFLRLSSPEDVWVCNAVGQWVKHGNPSAPMPTTGCDKTGLPNPASVHCEEVGGTLDIRTDATGGQVGYCILPDKTECEEWALLRNECQPKNNNIVEPVACTMEAKICPDGSSVGRSGPKCEFAPCSASNNSDEDFRNLSIKARDKITSPLKITGEVKGGWFFEGSFPINLVDWDGKIIATGLAEAKGEWMTTDYVSFTSEIKFTKPLGSNLRGAIIFKKDNPSGLSTNDKSYELPISF